MEPDPFSSDDTQGSYYKFGNFAATNELTGESYTENIDNDGLGTVLGHKY